MHAQQCLILTLNGAIVELTQLKCYYTQCSVLEKLNYPDLACGLAESRTLNPQELTRKEMLMYLPITFHYL